MAIVGPGGGLLSGLSQGLQLGMQKRQMDEQSAYREQMFKRGEEDRKFQIGKFFTEAFSGLRATKQGVNPDTMAAWLEEAKGVADLALENGIEVPPDIDPRTAFKSGALNPAAAGAGAATKTTLGMAGMPQAGAAAGSAVRGLVADKSTPTWERQGFGSREAMAAEPFRQQNLRWTENFGQYGQDAAGALADRVLQSKSPGEDMARGVAAMVDDFGPQHSAQILNLIGPDLRNAIQTRNTMIASKMDADKAAQEIMRDNLKQATSYWKTYFRMDTPMSIGGLSGSGADLDWNQDGKKREGYLFMTNRSNELIRSGMDWDQAINQLSMQFGGDEDSLLPLPSDEDMGRPQFDNVLSPPGYRKFVKDVSDWPQFEGWKFSYNGANGQVYAETADGEIVRVNPWEVMGVDQQPEDEAGGPAEDVGPGVVPESDYGEGRGESGEQELGVQRKHPTIGPPRSDVFTGGGYWDRRKRIEAMDQRNRALRLVEPKTDQRRLFGGLLGGGSTKEMTPRDKAQYRSGLGWPVEGFLSNMGSAPAGLRGPRNAT